MSQRSNQQQKPFRFWFPYWNVPTQTPSPERIQQQRSPAQSRSSTSQRPTASSAQRSRPSDSPSPSRKSSLLTIANGSTRKQQPSKSNTPTKPSSPPRSPLKMKTVDPKDMLGKPAESAELLRQQDRFKETKPERDEEKKLDETKAVKIPRLKVGQSDSEPKQKQGEGSEEGAMVKTNKPDLEPFRQDQGDSDQQKPIKEPKEIPHLTAKQSSLEPQQQSEASNHQKVYEKPEESIRKETTEADSIPKQNTEPSNKQKHDKNIPELSTNQKETAEKPLRISEDKSIPDLETDRGINTTKMAKLDGEQESPDRGRSQIKTEIHGKPHSSTSEKALDNQVQRDYTINGDEADEPHPKNGGTTHAAREKMTDKGNTSAKVKKEHESSGKVSKVSISTGPLIPFADGERADFQKEIREGLSKLVGKLSIGHSGNLRTDSGVSIITLAGKNKGAIMKIGNDSAKGSTKSKEEQKQTDEEVIEMAASVNSNVQSINNSFLNESKCKEKDPGVHLVLSAKPTEATSLKKKTKTLVSRNNSLSIPTPQKLLSYEPPNVRRRCLRGLMLEPSEDEEDGAQKTRRHGCRVGVGCDEKRKGKEDIDESTSKPS